MAESDIELLNEALAARHPCVSMLTFEEEYALDVVFNSATARGGQLWIWSNSFGLRDGMLRDSMPINDTTHPAGALAYLLQIPTPHGLVVFLDLAAHLSDHKTLRLLRDLMGRYTETGDSTVILIDPSDTLPAVIQGASARLELSFPAEPELKGIIKRTVEDVKRNNKLQVNLTQADVDAIVRNLRGLTRRQARQAILECVARDRVLDRMDVETVMRFKRRVMSKTGLLEFVEAPASMDEIGGLGKLKSWLETRNDALSDRAQEVGIEPPRGVLLLGVQGAGKSLAAKACATAWQRPLLRMDVGAFFNRFVGETERNMREAFRQAEMMAPVVLWVDEIEKAFASASAESADGGLSKRMFGALLTWMQEHKSSVFLIATANDIKSLPPELMRKGRFDEIFFVDLPTTEARRMIFSIHLKKRNCDPSLFDLDKLAETSTGFSGAEIEQAIRAAVFTGFAKNTLLSDQMIVEAIKSSPPLSVTMAESVAHLRAWAKNRCVAAD
ncbi:MAG TPA: AAA family ATPase [Tepidisphaeraceae bacterium]|nr:AAA family ATPase [Tepidisphaeraceae bacterium]